MFISAVEAVSRNLQPRLNDASLEEETSEGSESPTVEKVRVWVSYEIWQEKEVKVKRVPASTLRRGEKREGLPVAYRKSTSTSKGSPDSYSFEVDANNTSPEEFKMLGMIEVDHYIPNLSTYLLDPIPPKKLVWLASERTLKRVGVLYDIDEEAEWNNFIDILREPLRGSHYFNLLLKMSDPSLVRQAEHENETQQEALRTYQKKKIDDSAHPSRKNVQIPEPGASNERALLIEAIIHEHQDGDHSQCYEPGNLLNSFRVTLDCARVWADIMVSSKRRDHFNGGFFFGFVFFFE